MDHPHIHSIVTGGGLSIDENKWMSSRKNFFLPVKVLSRMFKGKFLYYLKQAYYGRNLKFTQDIAILSRYKEFQSLIDELYKKEWVIYSKQPFKGPKYVLEYLGRYTHRVAISNNRITRIDDGKVTFKWRDYKDNNKIKYMTIDALEFIRRFLLHILPYRFVKIRHYGILSNKNRNSKLKCCKELLGAGKGDEYKDSYEYETWEELLFRLTGIDITKCSCCSKGRMIRKRKIQPRCYSPSAAKDLTA